MNMTETKPTIEKLIPDALYSWNDIAPFVAVGRETWRRLVLAGEAPQANRIGLRCTRYRGSDVLAWLTSPTTYRAPNMGDQ